MPTLDRPVFVVGCGRSGTTLVGNLLGAHPDVVYLNEPRRLWGLDPRTKVWQPGPGRIVLTASDLSPELADGLRRQLVERVTAARPHRLVEKTPINSFRIGYLDALCPDARFVHVVRDGRAVAASIARQVNPVVDGSRRLRWPNRRRGNSPGSGGWYGVDDNKWHLLRSLAETERIDGIDVCEDDLVARALLEWRLAITFARRSLNEIDPRRCHEVRYEDALRQPRRTMSELLERVELHPADVVLDNAEGQIRAPEADRIPLNDNGRILAGALLDELGYSD